MGFERLRVAFVINSLGAGGAERVVSLLAGEFARLGHEPSILLRMNDGRPSRYPVAPGVRLVSLGSKPAQVALPVWVRVFDLALRATQGLFPGRLSATKRRFLLRQTIVSLRADVVLSFVVGTNLEVVRALHGTAIPVVISERNDPAAYADNSSKAAERDRLYAQAAGAVFQTKPAQDYFRGRVPYAGVVIPNPVEVLPRTIPVPRVGPPRVVSIGRLVAQKRYDVTLDALAEVARRGMSFSYEVYGEGPLAGEIQGRIDSLGLGDSVKLMGYSNAVRHAIAGAQLFVLSSDYEGMPNALIEAMVEGLPVVATDCPVGGPASLITAGVNGLLVPTGNVTALADAIEALLRDSSHARRLGDAARLVSERLSVDRVAGLWLDYVDLVRRNRE